jgi:hypothetical protein
MLFLFYTTDTDKYCVCTASIHLWYLNYVRDPDKDFVTLFFNLHVDLLVLEGDLVYAIFTRCNNSLEFRHIRTGHPPEIIIYKNNCRHETLSPGIYRILGLCGIPIILRAQASTLCEGSVLRHLTLFFSPGLWIKRVSARFYEEALNIVSLHIPM